MKAYLFDEDTKEYVGEITAQIDPLESEKEGKEIYLLPANSTFSSPLQIKEGYKIVWNGEEWGYEEIKAVETQQPSLEELKAIKRAERDEILQSTDKYLLPDFPITEEEKNLWINYRKYLRDLPESSDFPDVDVLNFEDWNIDIVD